eukprot:jgi/Sobl393_1/970/SZX72794.1
MASKQLLTMKDSTKCMIFLVLICVATGGAARRSRTSRRDADRLPSSSSSGSSSSSSSYTYSTNSYTYSNNYSSSSNSRSSVQQSPCTPAPVVEPHLLGVKSAALQLGRRPNFIVIVTDDQGWDDIGLHNPAYVNTPNLDRFIRNATLFDNFYTAPQCAQTRAAVLTGRSYQRTGTMLVNGGYDFLNSQEVNAGRFMAAGGYKTAHFGK